jgi:hypothetical protein
MECLLVCQELLYVVVSHADVFFSFFFLLDIIGPEQIRCRYDVGGLKRGLTHIYLEERRGEEERKAGWQVFFGVKCIIFSFAICGQGLPFCYFFGFSPFSIHLHPFIPPPSVPGHRIDIHTFIHSTTTTIDNTYDRARPPLKYIFHKPKKLVFQTSVLLLMVSNYV